MVGCCCELPAKPSVGLTEANRSNPVFGPFIRGLEYAKSTKFVNESAQRQVMMDMVQRIDIQGGQAAAESLAIAAEPSRSFLMKQWPKNRIAP